MIPEKQQRAGGRAAHGAPGRGDSGGVLPRGRAAAGGRRGRRRLSRARRRAAGGRPGQAPQVSCRPQLHLTERCDIYWCQ